MSARPLATGLLLLISVGVWRYFSPDPSPHGPRGLQQASQILASPELIPSGLLGISETSGITYHTKLDRLYVVGDRGELVELDSSAHRLRKAIIEGDLEDVAVHTPSGELLLLSENEAEIIRFDPQLFAVTGRCALDQRALLGEAPEDGREGFEGLAWLAKGTPEIGLLQLAHQRQPAAVITVAYDRATCATEPLGRRGVERRRKYQKCGSLSSICIVSSLDRSLALDSEARELLVLRSNGKVERRIPLPCVQPEGVCLDARGVLWIADDRRGLWKFPDSLARLEASLTRGAEDSTGPSGLTRPEGIQSSNEVAPLP